MDTDGIAQRVARSVLATKKVKKNKGWYQIGEFHVVMTERYGRDKSIDWVIVKDDKEAKRIWHGGQLKDILDVHTRLKDALNQAINYPEDLEG